MRFLSPIFLLAMIPCIMFAADDDLELSQRSASDSEGSLPEKSVNIKKNRGIKNLTLFRVQKSEESDQVKVERRMSDSELRNTISEFIGHMRGRSSSQSMIEKRERLTVDGGSSIHRYGSNKPSPLAFELSEQSTFGESGSPDSNQSKKGKQPISPDFISIKKISNIVQSPSQSTLVLQMERECNEKEEARKKKAQAHAILFFTFAGRYTGNKKYCERVKQLYKSLQGEGEGLDSVSRDKVDFYSSDNFVNELKNRINNRTLLSSPMSKTFEQMLDAMSSALQEEGHSDSIVDLCRVMLRESGIGAFAGEPKDFFQDSAYLLKNHKYAIKAVTTFGTNLKDLCDDIEEFVDIAESIFATISSVLIEEIKKLEEKLHYYRRLLFSTIDHAVSEVTKTEGEELIVSHRKSLSNAIDGVSSKNDEEQEVCLKHLKKCTAQAADRVLLDRIRESKKVLSYYKEVISDTAMSTLETHKKCLNDYKELEFSGMSNLLSQEIENLEYYNSLLPKIDQESKYGKHFGVESIKEQCDALLFDEAVRVLAKEDKQKGCEYYEKLKLVASEQILYRDIRDVRKKYECHIASLGGMLELVKRYRAMRKPSEGSALEVDRSRIDVTQIRNDMMNLQERFLGSEQLQEAFNRFTKKKEIERLRGALLALEIIEARDRCSKAQTKEA